MTDFAAKAREIAVKWTSAKNGGRLTEAIALALREAVAAEREALITSFETLAEMTTEPQSTCYRFVIHQIRSRSQGDRTQAEYGEGSLEPESLQDGATAPEALEGGIDSPTAMSEAVARLKTIRKPPKDAA